MTDSTTTETGELVERVETALDDLALEARTTPGFDADAVQERGSEALSTLQSRIGELEPARQSVDEMQDELVLLSKRIEELERERDEYGRALAAAQTAIRELPVITDEMDTSLQEARGLLHSLSQAVITWWADQEDEENAESLFAANDAVLPFLSSTKETE